MLDVHEQALARRLLPCVHLVERTHPARRDPGVGEPGEQVVGVVGVEDALDHLDHLVAAGHPLGVAPQALRVGFEAEREAEPLPQRLGPDGYLDGAVTAAEQTVRRDGRVVVALRSPHLPGDRPPGALEGVHPGDGRQQRGPHDLPDAGPVPLVQRRQHAVRAVDPGQQVADRHAHALRVVRAGARQGHEAGLALGDLVVPGAAALRPVVPEPGDGEHDEARVALQQGVDAQAEAVQHPGAEVLHEHVGPVDELEERRLVGVGLEVERDRLLVAVRGQEVRGLARTLLPDERRAPATRVVAPLGHLHLDDARAQVAQHHGGVRPGQRPGEVDDDDVGKGPAHGAHQPGSTRTAHTSSGPTRVTIPA